MSVEQLAARLGVVLSSLEQARGSLTAASAALDESRQVVQAALRGAADARAVEIPALFAQARYGVTGARELCERSEDAIRAYLAAIGAAVPPGTVPRVGRPASTPVRAPSPIGVVNRHGDRYPEEARPCSDHLPPRVIAGAGNVSIVGYLEVDGQPRGEIRATRDDVWSGEVLRRMRELGFPGRARRIYNHIEMKCVTMMVLSRGVHAQVIINHAPCGSEPGAVRGCEQYLPDFLPLGSSLTVLGSMPRETRSSAPTKAGPTRDRGDPDDPFHGPGPA